MVLGLQLYKKIVLEEQDREQRLRDRREQRAQDLMDKGVELWKEAQRISEESGELQEAVYARLRAESV